MYKYAIQHRCNGQLIDYCDTLEQARKWLGSYQMLEAINIDCASKVVVTYTETYANDYGHQEDSFTTYGGLKRCIVNLCKWMQSTARTFGPDARDIRDFFRHCRLYVNGKDKSEWLFNQIDKIDTKTIYL